MLLRNTLKHTDANSVQTLILLQAVTFPEPTVNVCSLSEAFKTDCLTSDFVFSQHEGPSTEQAFDRSNGWQRGVLAQEKLLNFNVTVYHA